MTNATVDWLLLGDPAIRWQTLRDLLDAPAAEWQAEQARTVQTGWGAQLLAQQDADGTWPTQNRYTGKVFFNMEKLGSGSRWNTLRALRILRWWNR